MAQISGQKTVTQAGTAEQLGALAVNTPLLLRALESNTGLVAVGNDGSNDVSLSTGYLLSAGDLTVFEFVGNLAAIYVNSEVDGEGVAWLALNA